MLLKPTKFQRDAERFDRRQANAKVRREVRQREWDAEKARRIRCFKRDVGRCRVSGVRLRLQTDNPYTLAHCHHLIFRSAGGSDELENRIIVSPAVHDRIHSHELDVTGDGNGTVQIVERNLETGQIVKAWESLCPTEVMA